MEKMDHERDTRAVAPSVPAITSGAAFSDRGSVKNWRAWGLRRRIHQASKNFAGLTCYFIGGLCKIYMHCDGGQKAFSQCPTRSKGEYLWSNHVSWPYSGAPAYNIELEKSHVGSR